jgi:hypothetical protein
MKLKLEGFSELINKMQDVKGWLPSSEIDSIVKSAAMPLVTQIKAGYKSGGHSNTGALSESISAFPRKRKSGDPYFTYFVGPKYGGSTNLSAAGNAAHLLERGTVERFRADTKKGGAGRKQGLKGVYGAKHSTGKVRAFGVIRKAADMYRAKGIENMKKNVVRAIIVAAKKANIST